ncbi:restriction endonuclease subunit S [Arthrobacter glacialis]|uniref:restriction endonuclease subunit S n=1 Tax=Arthrobacter glacialis TaxID=1664 RepID=UPI000CD40BF6|nr:restriction endonuclease subunit S [Arthrobacter glacialis]POH60305.1 hypothetical protein CVS28_05090 [Arthrobacter glacialis]
MTSNWDIGTLSDVAVWRSGGTPRSGAEEFYAGGSVPWAVIKDVNNSELWDTAKKITPAGVKAAGGIAPPGAVLLTMYGSIGRSAIARIPVATNQAIIWGVAKEGFLPEFIFSWIRSNEIILDSMGRGATQRNINGTMVRNFPIPLVPITEQRRIVDLIGALDDVIEAAQQATDECAQSWSSAILSELALVDADPIKAESMFCHIIGGAWGSPPGEEDTKVRAIGPSSYADSRIYVDLSLSTERSLSAKRAKIRSLELGDIVLERSGGSPTQPVGRVIRMNATEANVVPSDFMRLLRPDPAVVDSALAFWIMWALYRADASLPYQKFTTGIRNLNISDYLSGVSVRIPSTRDEQFRIVEIAESFLDAYEAAQDHVVSARALRSEIFTSLLSGAHTIPESYDELLEAADA